MKKLLLSFVLNSFVICTFYAQSNHEIYMRCSYSENYKKYKDTDKTMQDEMVLDISKSSSEFYSWWARKRRDVMDSLAAKGASLSEMLNAREQLNLPISLQNYTIYKHYPEKNKLLYRDRIVMEHYQYTDEMLMPDWEIHPEKRDILGYSCQKAVTTYYGREWTAWFTSEIPVSDGPWKLWGLPGLILDASDKENEFSFTCISIKKLESPEYIRVPKHNYIKLSKQKFDTELKEFTEDAATFMKKRGKSAPVEIGDDGKPVSSTKRKYVYIEQ